eukprot:NODE_697_length_5080_cov_0.072877.p2 type:complete len:278 gc:universal NODE_697_length_5080_cov_0.072877:4003-3170(-)
MPLEYALQHKGKFGSANPQDAPAEYPVINLKGPVGIEAFSEHALRQSKCKEYVFNLMVVGESGLGKSTFINSLFHSNILLHSHRPAKTIQLQQFEELLQENGVKLRLTLLDTVGFGMTLNRSADLEPILAYIKSQYETHLNSERSTERKQIQDTRIHCILYFIAPTGHGLKEVDVLALKTLSNWCNVIPVIAKGDSFTPQELSIFKNSILESLKEFEIPAYPFNSQEGKEQVSEILSNYPFAVVGSNENLKKENGKICQVRKYAWGQVKCNFRSFSG